MRDTYVGLGKRQTFKSSNFQRLEKKLYQWYLVHRNKNFIESGEMIKQKAKLIYSKISENESFIAIVMDAYKYLKSDLKFVF